MRLEIVRVYRLDPITFLEEKKGQDIEPPRSQRVSETKEKRSFLGVLCGLRGSMFSLLTFRF